MKYGFTLLNALLLASLAAHAAEPSSLKTEYLKNPLGIDTVKPRLSWIVEDATPGAKQTAYQVQAASSPEKLAQGEADLWNSGKVVTDKSHLVEYAGKPLVSRQSVWWRVKTWDKEGKEGGWSAPAEFEIGLLDKADWQARWIAAAAEVHDRSETSRIWANHTAQPGPDHAKNVEFLLSHFPPVPQFLKEFAVDGVVKRARLYLGVRGYAVPSLNGKRISDRRLDPAYREYDSNAHYITLDVTGAVKEGANVFGLELGGGWHGIGEERNISAVERNRMRDECFIARLDVETSKGPATVVSDDTWFTAPGPTVKSVFFAGEAYDANRAQSGWNDYGFTAEGWKPAKVVPEGTEKLIPMLIPPERLVGTVKPVKRYQVGENIWVFDFGQMFPGVIRLRAKLPKGTTIIQRWEQNNSSAAPKHYYEEPVKPPAGSDKLIGKSNGVVAGSIKTSACYVFTAKGGDEPEEWMPEFDYQSIRYVEVTGYPGEPPLDLLEGRILHTDLARIGAVETSDSNINIVLKRLTDTTLYCMHGILQDNNCAERQQGCTTAPLDNTAFTFETFQYHLKALDGLRLNTVNGRPPEVLHAMHRGRGRDDLTGIQSIAAFLPWVAWLFHGDPEILERHYPLMKAYLEGYAEQVEHRMTTLQDWGDWGDAHLGDELSRPGTPFFRNTPNGYNHKEREAFAGSPFPQNTPIALTAAAHYYRALTFTIYTAGVLGQQDDARRLRELAARIKPVFIANFYDPAAHSFGSQTADALALQYGLAPEGEETAVARSMRDDVMIKCGGHLSGGIYMYIVPAMLAAYGYADESALPFQIDTYPSWGQLLIKWGYNTVGERFPASRHSTGIGGNRRISGIEKTAAASWGYNSLAGIKPLQSGPGFKNCELSPCFPSNIESASAWHESPYGKIASAWKREGDTIRWNVTIPWNTSATVKLPGVTQITVNGKPQEQSEFDLPAGKWEIVAKQNEVPKRKSVPRKEPP